MDCPLCLTILVSLTSGSSVGKVLLLLLKNMETSPDFAGFFNFPPLYIRLEAFSARIDFEDLLPKTKLNASRILLFPSPLGPITQLYDEENGISVCFAKLLKPLSTILLILVPFCCWIATCSCLCSSIITNSDCNYI